VVPVQTHVLMMNLGACEPVFDRSAHPKVLIMMFVYDYANGLLTDYKSYRLVGLVCPDNTLLQGGAPCTVVAAIWGAVGRPVANTICIRVTEWQLACNMPSPRRPVALLNTEPLGHFLW
jgi:hypothetical protein